MPDGRAKKEKYTFLSHPGDDKQQYQGLEAKSCFGDTLVALFCSMIQLFKEMGFWEHLQGLILVTHLEILVEYLASSIGELHLGVSISLCLCIYLTQIKSGQGRVIQVTV